MDVKDAVETIQLDLPDDILLYLALEAHKRDITLNAFIVQILKEYIARLGE